MNWAGGGTFKKLVVGTVVKTIFEQFERNDRGHEQEEEVDENNSEKVFEYFSDWLEDDVHLLVPDFQYGEYLDDYQPSDDELVESVDEG